MGLLTEAADWLNGMLLDAAAPDGPVTYCRGAETVELTGNCWVGRTVFTRLPGEFGAAVVFGDRDYLVPREFLVLGGVEFEPRRGDRIRETVGGVVRVYEVSAPGDEPPWRWSDPGETRYRIHTKRER